MLPHTTSTQRLSLYTDVESLLSPGFLTHVVEANGVYLHLRSLCPGDIFMLRARAIRGTPDEWRIWTVASSIWMIDGVSVLGQDHAIPFLAKYLRDNIHKQLIDTMFHLVLGLFVRVDKAVDAAEPYCYENTARYRWKSSKQGSDLTAGVTGGERLGRNLIQGIWAVFNEVEDQRLVEESAWEGFKLVASSNSPKAVKKIDEGDRRRRQDEQARRQSILDRFFYYSKGLIDEDGYHKDKERDGLGARISGPKTVEDLEGEMRRWVTGEDDEHDRIVESYKQQITARQEAAQAEREARRIVLMEMREQQEQLEATQGPRPLVGLTVDQLQQVLRDRGHGVPGTKWVAEGPPGGQAQRLYDMYLAHELKKGALRAEGDRVVGSVVDNELALQTLVKDRQVAFGGGED